MALPFPINRCSNDSDPITLADYDATDLPKVVFLYNETIEGLKKFMCFDREALIKFFHTASSRRVLAEFDAETGQGVYFRLPNNILISDAARRSIESGARVPLAFILRKKDHALAFRDGAQDTYDLVPYYPTDQSPVGSRSYSSSSSGGGGGSSASPDSRRRARAARTAAQPIPDASTRQGRRRRPTAEQSQEGEEKQGGGDPSIGGMVASVWNSALSAASNVIGSWGGPSSMSLFSDLFYGGEASSSSSSSSSASSSSSSSAASVEPELAPASAHRASVAAVEVDVLDIMSHLALSRDDSRVKWIFTSITADGEKDTMEMAAVMEGSQIYYHLTFNAAGLARMKGRLITPLIEMRRPTARARYKVVYVGLNVPQSFDNPSALIWLTSQRDHIESLIVREWLAAFADSDTKVVKAGGPMPRAWEFHEELALLRVRPSRQELHSIWAAETDAAHGESKEAAEADEAAAEADEDEDVELLESAPASSSSASAASSSASGFLDSPRAPSAAEADAARSFFFGR